MVSQRPRRWICSFTGPVAWPATATRLPTLMFNRLAPTLNGAASATAGVAAVEAVRHSAPAPSAQRSVDRGMDPPELLAGQVWCLQGVYVGDPRAPVPLALGLLGVPHPRALRAPAARHDRTSVRG